MNDIATNELSESHTYGKEMDKAYDIHKYWSRKPWWAISQCIEKYSNKNEIVLDLFLGSGVTALESTILGRNFVGYDLNPIAIKVSENTISTSFDESAFDNDITIIKDKIETLAKETYRSSEICEICKTNLTIQHLNIGPKFLGQETAYLFCTDCGKSKTRCRVPLSSADMKNYLKNYPIRNWVPTTKFPSKFYKDRFSYKGVNSVNDMFSNRNLFFLSELLDVINHSNIKHRELLLLAFSNTILHGTKLKSENVRPLGVNNYWIPDDFIEENVWMRFLDRVRRVREAKQLLKNRITDRQLGHASIRQKSSLKTDLEPESIDYIITDPPYGDAIQYSELSFIWNAWLNETYDIENEVIVNPVQNKSVEDFTNFFDQSVREAYRVLKHGSYYTLCFHNKELKIWRDILNCYKKHGFSLTSIEIVKGKGSSYNVNWATFNPKTDFYLTFKKSEFSHRRHSEYSVENLLKGILETTSQDDNSKIYDLLAVSLIEEIYYNSFQVDLAKFNIKKITQMILELQSSK